MAMWKRGRKKEIGKFLRFKLQRIPRVNNKMREIRELKNTKYMYSCKFHHIFFNLIMRVSVNFMHERSNRYKPEKKEHKKKCE